MGTASVKTGVSEQCPVRERLLREWTLCGRHLAKLLDEHLAAVKRNETNFTEFEEQFG